MHECRSINTAGISGNRYQHILAASNRLYQSLLDGISTARYNEMHKHCTWTWFAEPSKVDPCEYSSTVWVEMA